MGLHLLSSMMSVELFEGEVGFQPRCRHPRGKHHRGQSILLPCCGCGKGERGPHAAPSGGRVAKASFPATLREELLGGVLNHGPLWGDAPWWVEPTKAAPSSPLLGGGGEAQATEVVGDELIVSKVNVFTEGEFNAC
jgi:hypothetical protein